MRFRWFSPGQMRFISPDLLMDLNRYAYVSGNPVSYIDPIGLFLINYVKKTNQIFVIPQKDDKLQHLKDAGYKNIGELQEFTVNNRTYKGYDITPDLKRVLGKEIIPNVLKYNENTSYNCITLALAGAGDKERRKLFERLKTNKSVITSARVKIDEHGPTYLGHKSRKNQKNLEKRRRIGFDPNGKKNQKAGGVLNKLYDFEEKYGSFIYKHKNKETIKLGYLAFIICKGETDFHATIMLGINFRDDKGNLHPLTLEKPSWDENAGIGVLTPYVIKGNIVNIIKTEPCKE